MRPRQVDDNVVPLDFSINRETALPSRSIERKKWNLMWWAARRPVGRSWSGVACCLVGWCRFLLRRCTGLKSPSRGYLSGVFPAPSPQLISPALIRHVVHRAVHPDRIIDAINQGRDSLFVADIRHMLAMWMDIATAAPQAIERPAILRLPHGEQVGERKPQAHRLPDPAICASLLNDQKGLSDQIVARESGHIQTSTKQERLGKAAKRTNIVAQSKRT